MLRTDDPIGDTRALQHALRFQRGDRVQWQDDSNCWRQGVIVTGVQRFYTAVIIDSHRGEICDVSIDRLHRVYPREGDE